MVIRACTSCTAPPRPQGRTCDESIKTRQGRGGRTPRHGGGSGISGFHAGCYQVVTHEEKPCVADMFSMARGNAPVALVSHEARYQLGLDVTGVAVRAAEAEAKGCSAVRALRRAPRGQVSERGSTAVGYVGLVVIAAMIVGALYLAVAQSSLAQHVRAGVCRVITPDQVCEVPVSAQTPYERATSGAYVAMGDSYASGEGAENYLEGTDYDHRDEWHRESWEDDKHNRCHRSGNAYAETIGRQNGAPRNAQG